MDGEASFFKRDGQETDKQLELMNKFEELVSPVTWRLLVFMGIGPEFRMEINPHGTWSMHIRSHTEEIVSAVFFIHEGKLHFSKWRMGQKDSEIARLEK